MKNALEQLVKEILNSNLLNEAWKWLQEKGSLVHTEKTAQVFNTTFVLIPRKTGHQAISVNAGMLQQINEALPGFSIEQWTADRLSRLWLVMQLPSADKNTYTTTIENLFKSAEMNELVALYSALPVFAYAEDWQHRCTEGIRSNIGTVLEAIMYNNPYPAKYLDDKAWNQLVLKAFFTEKDINRIVGIDERANKELATTLLDYVDERWAAGRTINPQLWRLVSKFIDAGNVHYFKKLLQSPVQEERNAAALACYKSDSPAAKELLLEQTELNERLSANEISWQKLHID